MLWPILGCLAAVLLVLAWWHRVLLTTWSILGLMWFANRILPKLVPKRWEIQVVRGPIYKLMMFGLQYAVNQVENGIGGHCFEEDD